MFKKNEELLGNDIVALRDALSIAKRLGVIKLDYFSLEEFEGKNFKTNIIMSPIDRQGRYFGIMMMLFLKKETSLCFPAMIDRSGSPKFVFIQFDHINKLKEFCFQVLGYKKDQFDGLVNTVN